MNTIQDMIKAIKQLQKEVAELKAKPVQAPAPSTESDTPRRGRGRTRVEGEEVL